MKYNRKQFIYNLQIIIENNNSFDISVLGRITIYVAQRDLLLSVLIYALPICKNKVFVKYDWKIYSDHSDYIRDNDLNIYDRIGWCIRELKIGELILLTDGMGLLNILEMRSRNKQYRLQQLDDFLGF
jgi:hypothetical protein